MLKKNSAKLLMAGLALGMGLMLYSCGDGGTTSSVSSNNPGSALSGAQATLTWNPPAINADGSLISNLAGYHIYYGTVTPVTMTNSQVIEAGNSTTYGFSGLQPGLYHFAVSAYNQSGDESDLSAEVSRTIQ